MTCNQFHVRLQSRLFVVAIATLANVGVRGGLAEETSTGLERYLPGNSQLAFLVDNASDTGRRFGAVPIGKMLGSPSWQPYFSLIRETHSPSLLHLRPWFGIDWGDIAEFPVPFAFVLFPDQNSKVAMAVVVDSHDNAPARDALLGRAAKYFQERGARVATEKLPNGKRTSFQMPAGFAGSSQPVTLEHQGLLAFVNSLRGAEALNQFWNQTKSSPLLQTEEYRQAIRAASESLGGVRAIRGWMRPLPLAHSVARPPEKPRGSRRDWLASAERQGGNAVQAIGAVFLISPTNPPSLEVAFSIQARRPFAKALQMTSLVPGAWRDPPAFVADSVASWWMVYQDVPRWFDGFGFLFDEITDPVSPGTFRDILEAEKKDPEGPQIDIEKEIVARLNPGLVQVHDYGAAKSPENPDGFRQMYQLSVRETDPLRDVFKRYFKGDDLVRVSEIEKSLMWNTTTGHSILFETGEEKSVTFTGLAVTKDTILLSTDVDWLRSVLPNAKPAQPLSSSVPFLAAAKYLRSHPSEKDSLRSYIRLDQTWRPPYRQFIEGKSDAGADPRVRLLELLLCPNVGSPRSRVLAALPPWTSVAPSLGVSAVSLRATADGFAGYLGVLPGG